MLFSVLMGNIRFSFWENNLGHAVSSLHSQAEGITTGCSSQGLGRVLQSCFSTGQGWLFFSDYSSCWSSLQKLIEKNWGWRSDLWCYILCSRYYLAVIYLTSTLDCAPNSIGWQCLFIPRYNSKTFSNWFSKTRGFTIEKWVLSLSKSVFKMLLDKELLLCLKLSLLKYLDSIFLPLVNWEMAIAGLYQALFFM